MTENLPISKKLTKDLITPNKKEHLADFLSKEIPHQYKDLSSNDIAELLRNGKKRNKKEIKLIQLTAFKICMRDAEEEKDPYLVHSGLWHLENFLGKKKMEKKKDEITPLVSRVAHNIKSELDAFSSPHENKSLGALFEYTNDIDNAIEEYEEAKTKMALLLGGKLSIENEIEYEDSIEEMEEKIKLLNFRKNIRGRGKTDSERINKLNISSKQKFIIYSSIIALTASLTLSYLLLFDKLGSKKQGNLKPKKKIEERIASPKKRVKIPKLEKKLVKKTNDFKTEYFEAFRNKKYIGIDILKNDSAIGIFRKLIKKNVITRSKLIEALGNNDSTNFSKANPKLKEGDYLIISKKEGKLIIKLKKYTPKKEQSAQGGSRTRTP